MTIRFRRIIFTAAIVFSFGGCATPKIRKGDAVFWESRGGFFSMSGYCMAFPQRISLGFPGRTIIRIRDLPAPIFPHCISLEIPRAEADRYRNTQPWRRAVVKVEFRTIDGEVFFSKDLRFSKGFGSQDITKARTRIAVCFIRSFADERALRQTTNYDVVVQVMQPSRRRADTIQIDPAFTYHNFSN